MTRLASLALIAALLAACTSAQPASAPRATPQAPAQVPAVDIFDQGTWEKSLTSTDCGDYLTKMTGPEQFHIARLLLHQHRTMTLASAPAPDGALVTRFQQEVADICGEQGSDYPLIAATAVVYTMEAGFEPAYR